MITYCNVKIFRNYNKSNHLLTSNEFSGDGSQFDGRWSIESSAGNPDDLGLVVKDKAKHHAISAKLNKKIDFSELHGDQKQFVVQVGKLKQCCSFILVFKQYTYN